MCLKNRMTETEGQRLLDLLHLLKNDTGLLDTVHLPEQSHCPLEFCTTPRLDGFICPGGCSHEGGMMSTK